MDIPRDHNKPPQMLELARETTLQISGWFANNPAVSTADDARKIKLHIDRAKLCLNDLEDERDSRVRPLNDQVDDINSQYREIKKPLNATLNTMRGSLEVYVKAEEQRRIEIALEAERVAREAEVKAREADRIAREALENAQVGEVGIDVAAVTKAADDTFRSYEVSKRAAIRAQEEIQVRIAGGFSRSISQREREVLDVVDAVACLQDMVELPENVRLAIITAARAFKKVKGRLPLGISSTIERKLL